MTKRIFFTGLAFVVFTITLLTLATIFSPRPAQKKQSIPIILVETINAELQDLQFQIPSQGPVNPLIKSNLVAEVSGQVTDVSPTFKVGSFIKKGDVLLTIDPANYVANLRSAQAALAQAKANYQDAKARTEQARKDWKKIGKGEPNDMVLRIPQLNQAKASVQSAEASVLRAQKDLSKTKVTAKFDALVKSKQVDLGQYVNTGFTLGLLFGTDKAEVRLPLPDKELSFLQLPAQGKSSTFSDVTLSGIYAGSKRNWYGKIVRTEGVVDESNRLTYLVAEIDDPYQLTNTGSDFAPLRYGTFVQAKISGLSATGVFQIPEASLVNKNQVMLFDGEGVVKFKEVNIIRNENNAVIVSGLSNEDEVIVTPIENPVDGMKVRKIGEANQTAEAEPEDDKAANTANVSQ